MAEWMPTKQRHCIFAVWSDELTRGLVEPKLGADVFKAQYGKRHFRLLLENAMQQPNSPWCAHLKRVPSNPQPP